MELGQILSNIKDHIKIAYDYCYPYVIELYNYLYSIILSNKPLFIVIGLIVLYLSIKSRRLIKLKKKKFKRARLAKSKKFYNTGFRFEINQSDVIKIKIRFSDYCDKSGMHYCYLFNIKLLGLEFLRAKYIDQKGQVYKRKVTFRS